MTKEQFGEGKMINDLGIHHGCHVEFSNGELHGPVEYVNGGDGEVERLRAALKGLIEDLEMRAKNGVVDCSHGVYSTARAALRKEGGE